jgi:hypothetical protein
MIEIIFSYKDSLEMWDGKTIKKFAYVPLMLLCHSVCYYSNEKVNRLIAVWLCYVIHMYLLML